MELWPVHLAEALAAVVVRSEGMYSHDVIGAETAAPRPHRAATAGDV